jgi:hypothetical protein
MAHSARPVRSSLLRFRKGDVNRIRSSLFGLAFLPGGSLGLVADETSNSERLEPDDRHGSGGPRSDKAMTGGSRP